MNYEVYMAEEGWYAELIHGTVDDPIPPVIGPFDSEDLAHGAAFRYYQHG